MILTNFINYIFINDSKSIIYVWQNILMRLPCKNNHSSLNINSYLCRNFWENIKILMCQS